MVLQTGIWYICFIVDVVCVWCRIFAIKCWKNICRWRRRGWKSVWLVYFGKCLIFVNDREYRMLCRLIVLWICFMNVLVKILRWICESWNWHKARFMHMLLVIVFVVYYLQWFFCAWPSTFWSLSEQTLTVTINCGLSRLSVFLSVQYCYYYDAYWRLAAVFSLSVWCPCVFMHGHILKVCENNILQTTSGNFTKFTTQVHLATKGELLDFEVRVTECGHISTLRGIFYKPLVRI